MSDKKKITWLHKFAYGSGNMLGSVHWQSVAHGCYTFTLLSAICLLFRLLSFFLLPHIST